MLRAWFFFWKIVPYFVGFFFCSLRTLLIKLILFLKFCRMSLSGWDNENWEQSIAIPCWLMGMSLCSLQHNLKLQNLVQYLLNKRWIRTLPFCCFCFNWSFGKIGKAELNHSKWSLNPSDGAISFLVVCMLRSDAEWTFCFVVAVILHLYGDST